MHLFSLLQKNKKRIELHPLICQQPHTGETREKKEEEEEAEEGGGDFFITMLNLTRRFTQKLCT